MARGAVTGTESDGVSWRHHFSRPLSFGRRGCKRAGDTIAVSVAVDWQPDIPAHCAVVADTLDAPGPAHSIARLARFAMDRNEDLVFMAVDMLGVTPNASVAEGSARRLRSEPVGPRSPLPEVVPDCIGFWVPFRRHSHRRSFPTPIRCRPFRCCCACVRLTRLMCGPRSCSM